MLRTEVQRVCGRDSSSSDELVCVFEDKCGLIILNLDLGRTFVLPMSESRRFNWSNVRSFGYYATKRELLGTYEVPFTTNPLYDARISGLNRTNMKPEKVAVLTVRTSRRVFWHVLFFIGSNTYSEPRLSVWLEI